MQSVRRTLAYFGDFKVRGAIAAKLTADQHKKSRILRHLELATIAKVVTFGLALKRKYAKFTDHAEIPLL